MFDPDEGYYPSTAAETLRSGPFWDLRFNGAPRWDKPVLSYALIQGAFLLFGENATAARIPSAIETAALIAIIGLLVSRLAGDRAGLLSAVIAGTTMGVSIFSRIAHPEIGVVLSIITTELLLCVWLTTAERRVQRLTAAAAGVSLGFGLLTKGPVAMVLPAVTLVCVLPCVGIRRDRARRLVQDAVLSVVIAAAVALPWYGAMALRHGLAFLHDGVWQQNVGRYTTAVYGHPASIFSMSLAVLLGLIPWVGLLPQAAARLHLRPRTAREILRFTMFASAILALAFYALATSKLPSYSLVCVPPLAIVIGIWLDDEWTEPAATRWGWMQTGALLGSIAAALLSASWWIGHVVTTRQLLGALRPEAGDVAALLAPVVVPVGVLMASGAVLLIAIRGTMGRIITGALLGLLAPVLALVTAAPMLETIYPWQALGTHIQPGRGHVWLLDRRAPSLTFYARQEVSTARDAASLQSAIVREAEGWLAITHGDWDNLTAGGGMTHMTATVVAHSGRMVLVRFTNPSADTRLR